MSLVKFSDVVVRANTKADKDNTHLKFYVGGEHIDTDEVLIEKRGIIAGSNIGPMFYFGFKAGQVLLVSRNPHLRKAGMVTFDGICSEKTFVLQTKDETVLLQRFLPFVLQSKRFWDYAESHKSGSVNFFINWSTLANYEFDLPDIETQRKLANVLWAINETKEAYKKLLTQTDDLLKSQFMEMFGDIEEHIMLGDCSSLHARVGWQALKKDEHQKTGEYMLITGTDFIDGRVNYDTCVYVSKERYDMDPFIQIQDGDILITKDGTIGKVAIVENLPKPATLNAGVFVVRPDGRFNKGYFAYLFKGPIFAEFVEASKTGTTIKHLNQEKLLKYNIPVASMPEQESFARLFEMSDKSKLELTEAISSCKSMMKKIISDNL